MFLLFGNYEFCCCEHCVQIFVWRYVLKSPGYKPSNGIDGSYDNLILNFLRNCQTVFQLCFAILHSQQQDMRIPVSLHPCQYLLVFLWIALLVGVKYLNVVLSSILKKEKEFCPSRFAQWLECWSVNQRSWVQFPVKDIYLSCRFIPSPSRGTNGKQPIDVSL